MSKAGLIVRVVVVTVALSAMFSATASAAQETRFFVEGTELATAETVFGVPSVGQLSTTVAGAKVMVECTAGELTATGMNTIEASGKMNAEVSIKRCYLFTISKGAKEIATACKVREPIILAGKGQLIAGVGGIVETEITPTSGSTFVTVTIENAFGKTCLLSGSFSITGSYVVSTGPEAERQTTEHDLVATSTGSKLKFASELASITISISKLQLNSNKAFY